MQSTYTIGSRTFVLDKAKAEAALAAKRVVGGRETLSFNLLPLRYGWAYELYRTMKANHWEPEDVQMGKDIEQWRDARALSEIDRWIVRMGIGPEASQQWAKACMLSGECIKACAYGVNPRFFLAVARVQSTKHARAETHQPPRVGRTAGRGVLHRVQCAQDPSHRAPVPRYPG